VPELALHVAPSGHFGQRARRFIDLVHYDIVAYGIPHQEEFSRPIDRHQSAFLSIGKRRAR
jgi:hypothetical protein